MPPRGYRDESKRLEKSLDRETLELVRVCEELGYKERAATLRKALADRAEAKALEKAQYGLERQIQDLVRMGLLQARDEITAWAAAGKIAEKKGGDPRARHALQKTLHRKFQQAPALYRRLALRGGDPADAAAREDDWNRRRN